MKKLKRISLDILANDLKKLTEQEMYMTFGGNGINGYCYFYTLEYLSSQFGGVYRYKWLYEHVPTRIWL